MKTAFNNFKIKGRTNLISKFFSTSLISSSHVGNRPIIYSPSIQFVPIIDVNSTKINTLKVIGPKGQLSIKIHPFININHLPSTTPKSIGNSISNIISTPINPLTITVLDATNKYQRSIWGLTRSLISNAIVGVSIGYTLSLRLVGVGYRATLESIDSRASSSSLVKTQRLNLKLGYAHPVLVELPQDVSADVPSSTTIMLSGLDKQRLGEVAARIRNWRIPEPYNGKGIFVGDETVRRKEVKKK